MDMGGCQNYGPFWGYIGVIWGIMEKKMETTIMGYKGIIEYMGGCQNYGPFLDPCYNTAPSILGYPKRDHNHPYVLIGLTAAAWKSDYLF